VRTKNSHFQALFRRLVRNLGYTGDSTADLTLTKELRSVGPPSRSIADDRGNSGMTFDKLVFSRG
jgi:hypothetical protein